MKHQLHSICEELSGLRFREGHGMGRPQVVSSRAAQSLEFQRSTRKTVLKAESSQREWGPKARRRSSAPGDATVAPYIGGGGEKHKERRLTNRTL